MAKKKTGRTRAAAMRPSVGAPEASSVPPAPPPGPPRRVLIVDDNADSAELLAMLLTLSGHVVQTASDGLEAVEQVTAFAPDVVLMDIGLPKLNGYDAARRIRAHARDHRPILVAVTGLGQDEDHRRSIEAGFDAHLVKPVDEADLMRVLSDELIP